MNAHGKTRSHLQLLDELGQSNSNYFWPKMRRLHHFQNGSLRPDRWVPNQWFPKK